MHTNKPVRACEWLEAQRLETATSVSELKPRRREERILVDDSPLSTVYRELASVVNTGSVLSPGQQYIVEFEVKTVAKITDFNKRRPHVMRVAAFLNTCSG